MATTPAMAEELQNWSFDSATNELTFSLPDTVLPEFFLLAEPPRLVLDIPETQVGEVSAEQRYDGSVQTIRVAQQADDQVRVVIELSPDIVLSPEQADIQFDDQDGQRQWRFRPLISGEVETADLSERDRSASAPTLNVEPGVSVAAENLIPQQSSQAVLPIDPYESGTSQVVSVPPLDNDAGGSDGAGITPELPPMTVPVLEADTAAVAATNPAPDQSAPVVPALPDLQNEPPPAVQVDDDDEMQAPGADELLAETAGDQVSVAQPAEVPSDSPVAAEPMEAAPIDEPVVAEPMDAPVAAAEPVEAAPIDVAAISPAADVGEPVAAVSEVTPPEIEPVEPQVALVEESVEPALVAEPNAPQSWETIQQPAAERTIVQTVTPTPITFGQPLPDRTP
ncbi:AMIN domain-containing protein [Leptothoe kymatousa]|uniref:AMIN domain-containing protein n=1 Tax=Leptothoe kymatousa TAU-MAC 1615 TaxID=2364775 RepID=A0ABS5Y707_9CYAN|nr:AMIN domain-containing protein [Leptothoe kymatousa]MBT9313381.1 AMIN domain-containing protein [Leptothoe kymatousa TAU-MAC 1615]